MSVNRSLKIWTIITHCFIIIGAGHGIACLGLVEIVTFPYFTYEGFSFQFDFSSGNPLPVVGLFSFLGQIALVSSILIKRSALKVAAHIGGFVLLWLSVLFFVFASRGDYYVHFLTVSAVPFSICTLITFIGPSIHRGYHRWLEK